MTLYIENPEDSTTKLLKQMNSVKLQDTKYRKVSCFHTLILTYQNKKQETEQENNPIYNCNKKNKIPKNKFNQRGERPVCGKL